MVCLPCHRRECPTCHDHYYRDAPWGPVSPQASRVASYMLTKYPELDLAATKPVNTNANANANTNTTTTTTTDTK